MTRARPTSRVVPSSELVIAERRRSIVVMAPTTQSTRAAVAVAECLADRFDCDVAVRPTSGDEDPRIDRGATDVLLCIGLPTAARRSRSTGRSAAARAVGSFDGPVLFVSDRCATDWRPTAGPILAMPATHSTGAPLLGHAAAWSRDVGTELWLAAVIDRKQGSGGDDDADLRNELLAASMLGRLARDLKRAGADAEWDVLYGQGPLAAAHAVMGTRRPAVIALELARPVVHNRALWATVQSVARRGRMPVLTLPPCPPPRNEAPAPPGRPSRSVAPRRPAVARRPGDASLRSAVSTFGGAALHQARALPLPSSEYRAPATRTLRWRVLAAVGLLVLPMIGALSQIDVPYYAIHPGATPELESLVHVEGAPTFAAGGAIRFVTVRATDVTLAGAVRGWLDGDIDVVHADAPPAEVVRQWHANSELMERSKLDAASAALGALGYAVVERGSGAQIVSLEYDAPAAALLQSGDVVVGIASQRAEFAEDLALVTRAATEGDTVAIDYLRQGTGDVRSGVVQLGRLADGTIGLGAMVQTRDLTVEAPVDIEISTPNVVGPSAGLAFALGLLEGLSPGSLTGERDVVATGAIDADGVVTAVGGIRQKVIAAKRSGASVLLVPTAQLDVAERHARGALRVIGVGNLHEAVGALLALGGEPIRGLRTTTTPSHTRHVVAT